MDVTIFFTKSIFFHSLGNLCGGSSLFIEEVTLAGLLALIIVHLYGSKIFVMVLFSYPGKVSSVSNGLSIKLHWKGKVINNKDESAPLQIQI